MDTPKENGLTPHAVHGTSVADSEEWVYVDDLQVDELLHLLARMRELLLLVLGRNESDLDDIATCFGATQP